MLFENADVEQCQGSKIYAGEGARIKFDGSG
jgi:hypothetical protein